MRMLRMIVVIRAVQIGRHHGDVVRPVLPVQELAVLQARYLRQGVSLVRLLQRPGQQAALRHRLRRHARIDARRPQELQLLATVLPGRMDNIHLQNHVVVHEVRQRALVGDYTANLGGGQEHILWLLRLEKRLHIRLPAKVQFLVRSHYDIGITLPPKLADNGRTHHSPVPGHIDLAILLHHPTCCADKVCELSSCHA